jgi:DNA-binding MurR/RpiR family transcriptional regulator
MSTVENANPQNVISELRRRYDELTNSQKRIAETIVDDPEFVAFATVDKLAGRLGVSPSTIVRFAYRLGMSGYPELQDQVRDLVLRRLRPEDGAAGDEIKTHLGDTMHADSIRNDVSLLTRTAERLDPGELDRAVDLLVGARFVRIIGGLTTFSVAYYTSVSLDRVRAGVALLTGNPPATGSVLDLDERDVLLAFTFAPYARSTRGILAAAKRRNVSVIAVTDSPISPLRAQVDVLLHAAVSGIGTQNSLVGPMAVANTIVNGVSGRSPDALERYSDTVRLLNEWDVFLLQSGGDA